MKKLLCILLSALMMALPLSSLAEEAAPTPEPFQAQALVTEEKLEQMIPVLDSFANTMGIEGEYTYDIQRPDFVWTQLYLMGMNWADWYGEITQTSEELVVPASLMQRPALTRSRPCPRSPAPTPAAFRRTWPLWCRSATMRPATATS